MCVVSGFPGGSREIFLESFLESAHSGYPEARAFRSTVLCDFVRYGPARCGAVMSGRRGVGDYLCYAAENFNPSVVLLPLSAAIPSPRGTGRCTMV